MVRRDLESRVCSLISQNPPRIEFLAETRVRLAPFGRGSGRGPGLEQRSIGRRPQLAAGTAYPLIGTVMPLKEIIATFGRVLGRNVRYEEISDEEWRGYALSRGYNEDALAHLSSLWRALRSAAIDPKDPRFRGGEMIEKVGGAKPKTFEAFVRESQSEPLAKSA